MISKSSSFVLFFIWLSLAVAGCCNCGVQKENTITGVITVIGNEPFAKLAVKTAEGKFFVLDCPKEVEEKLYKKQGVKFILEYDDAYEKVGEKYLKIISITEVKNN